MNAFALSHDEVAWRSCEASAVEDRPRPLAAFAPKANIRLKSNRAAGLIAVAFVHGVLALTYAIASPRFYKPADRTVTVVNVVPEVIELVDPPPVMPIFEPPAVYVPVPIMAEIQLSTPPPPPVITVAAVPPSPPTAPMAQTPPPETGRGMAPPPPISAPDRNAFASKLFGHLNRYKRYPPSARATRQEGVVSLRFTMDRQGHVLSFEIAKTSGSTVLDREAQELLKRAEPLPPIPIAFKRETLDLVVPVEFFLR